MWNNCPAMPPISIPMRASGIISSASNWVMSAVLISMTCLPSSFEPENGCDTSARSSKAAHDTVATRLSHEREKSQVGGEHRRNRRGGKATDLSIQLSLVLKHHVSVRWRDIWKSAGDAC